MLMKESNFSLCFMQDVQFLAFLTYLKFGFNYTDPNRKDQQQLYQNKWAKICISATTQNPTNYMQNSIGPLAGIEQLLTSSYKHFELLLSVFPID